MKYKLTGTSMWSFGLDKSTYVDTPDMIRCFINNQIVEVVVISHSNKLIIHDPFLNQYRQYSMEEYDNSDDSNITEFILAKINDPNSAHTQDWSIQQRFKNWKRFFDMGEFEWSKLDE